MATCPRCLGPLSDGHKCRPIWIKRVGRQASASFLGGVFGAFLSMLIWPSTPPVLGFVIGGLVGFLLSEALTAAV